MAHQRKATTQSSINGHTLSNGNGNSHGNGHLNGHSSSPPLLAPPTKPPTEEESGLLAWCMARQLQLSLGVVVFVLAGNVVIPPSYYLGTDKTPDPSWHIRGLFSRALHLSFQKPGTPLYYKGRDDAYVIAFWFAFFWFIREAAMRWAWEPLARYCGIRTKRSIVRFAEQTHALSYALVSCSVGLYIMQTSPYRNLNTNHFWIGYPHDALLPLAKLYYLVQTAFWLQQIVVLNLEARRKDHWQMFAHHIITVLLMTSSYVLNYTRVGNAILVTMDVVDIFLPLGKLFVYTKKTRMADATFVVFMLSWILTRLVIFGRIIWAIVFELGPLLPYGWRPRDGYFFNFQVHVGFTVLLLALQALLVIWTAMIFKVAYNTLMGKGANDSRSEAGDSDQDMLDDEDEVVRGAGEKMEEKKETNGARLNGDELTSPAAVERKKDR
ncbi:longevity assurance proteins LAG1/LAC1 [Meredithblackwellia eburnea MCA 4105]